MGPVEGGGGKRTVTPVRSYHVRAAARGIMIALALSRTHIDKYLDPDIFWTLL